MPISLPVNVDRVIVVVLGKRPVVLSPDVSMPTRMSRNTTLIDLERALPDQVLRVVVGVDAQPPAGQGAVDDRVRARGVDLDPHVARGAGEGVALQVERDAGREPQTWAGAGQVLRGGRC